MNELITIQSGVISLTPATAEKLVELDTLKKSVDSQYKELKDAILEAMTNSGVYKIENDSISITAIAETTRESFDSKRFRKEYPMMYDEFVNISLVAPSLRVKIK